MLNFSWPTYIGHYKKSSNGNFGSYTQKWQELTQVCIKKRWFLEEPLSFLIRLRSSSLLGVFYPMSVLCTSQQKIFTEPLQTNSLVHLAIFAFVKWAICEYDLISHPILLILCGCANFWFKICQIVMFLCKAKLHFLYRTKVEHTYPLVSGLFRTLPWTKLYFCRGYCTWWVTSL